MATINFGAAPIPVFDRFAKSYPQHDQGEPAAYGPASDAFETAFEWDAHFSAYSLPTVERRLGTAAALALKPKMVLVVFDVDGPDHKCDPAWWAAEKDRVRALFKAHTWGYAYTTKGGYRVVLGLKAPVELATPQDALRWRFSYLDWVEDLRAKYGIIADDKCADWTRCFRLPRVRRDGVDVVPQEELGRHDSIGQWLGALCAADDPRVLRTDQVFEVSTPAPIPGADEAEKNANLEAAAEALVAAWPPRSRHYAGMALCGALGKAGWSEDAIADFVCYVMMRTVGDPEGAKWSKQARDVLDKLHRGENITGWPTLEDLLCTGLDGALDESRREKVKGAILSSQRSLGQGPPIDLLEVAREQGRVAAMATQPAAVKAVLDESRIQLAADIAAAKDEEGGGQRFNDLLDAVAAVLPDAIEQAESKAKVVDARPMGMTYRTMRKRNLPPPACLIEGLIPTVGVGALSGEPKAAKSWDATYMAVAVAAGVQKVYAGPGRAGLAVQRAAKVFYFYAEDTEAAVNIRVAAIAAVLGIDPEGDWTDRLVMQPRGRPLDVMNTAQLCVLAASVKNHEAGGDCALLILDPLSNIHSGEEDKRDSMVKVMARLHALEIYLACAVLFIHHAGKTSADNKNRTRGGQKMRGSSAIHGAVDYGIYLSHPGGNGKTEFIARVESEMKAARGAGIFDRHLVLEDNEHGNAIKATFTAEEPKQLEAQPEDLSDERSFAIVKALFMQGAPMTTDELKRKIKGKSDILTTALQIAEAEGWIEKRFHGGRGAGYQITEKGRELIRNNGSGGQDDGDPPEPVKGPPSGGSLAFISTQP